MIWNWLGWIFLWSSSSQTFLSVHKKVKFSIKYLFSKFGRKLRMWSHLLKKSLRKNFIFCVVTEWMYWNISQIHVKNFWWSGWQGVPHCRCFRTVKFAKYFKTTYKTPSNNGVILFPEISLYKLTMALWKRLLCILFPARLLRYTLLYHVFFLEVLELFRKTVTGKPIEVYLIFTNFCLNFTSQHSHLWDRLFQN